MKIPLEITEFYMPSITAILKAPKYHVFGTVQFIIDTGSNVTDLSEGDATRLNIPYKNLFKTESCARLGGTRWKVYEMNKVTLIFRDINGKKIEILLDKIEVIKGSRTKLQEREKALETPSIIGNDFLVENKLFLYHNPVKKESYLQKI